MGIEAVIFDLDGLLVDSEPVWDRVRKGMADELGRAWDKDDHKAIMGTNSHEWAVYMIERLGLDQTPKEVEDSVVARMVAAYRIRIPFFPGAVAAVQLAAAHFPTALASGSAPALIDLVTNDPAMRGKFNVILSADEIGVGKPSPDIYLICAERLGVKPQNCVCLEDSGNGILAGMRAGMKVIAVPDPRFPPAPEKLEPAHVVLGSLAEFSMDLLRQL
jgi:beta-phosphoglucomutase-like phosphatase (HAD superfamily)